MYKEQTHTLQINIQLQFSAYYRQIVVFASISTFKYKKKYFYLLTNIYIYNMREAITLN